MKNEHIFRIEKFQIESHPRKNQSINRKIVWDSTFYCGPSVRSSFHSAQGHYLLCHIFHYGFGKWRIRIATSILVSFRLYSDFWMQYDFYVTRWLLRYPFDWKNPFGFLICAALQYRMILHSLRLLACVLSLALGAFLFAISMVKELKSELITINEMAKRKKTRPGVAKKLYNFLEVHTDLKRLSKSRLNLQGRG